MNRNIQLSLAAFAISATAILAGCGGKTPSLEEVKAWRLKTTPTYAYKIDRYEVSDLKCGSAPSKEVEKIKKAYSFFGGDADKTIQAYASCSYTVNAKATGVSNRLGIRGRDYEIKGHQVKDEIWLLGATNGKTEWQGDRNLKGLN